MSVCGDRCRPVGIEMVLETIEANPVKKQKTASLISQVLTVLKAKVAVKDDVLGFVADPPPVINCANGETLAS